MNIKNNCFSFLLFYFVCLKNQPSMDPLFQNYSSNCTLCNECKNDYINITQFFLSLGDENEFCMDVVDLVI